MRCIVGSSNPFSIRLIAAWLVPARLASSRWLMLERRRACLISSPAWDTQ